MNVRAFTAIAVSLLIIAACTREPPPCQKDPPPYLKGTVHDCAMRDEAKPKERNDG